MSNNESINAAWHLGVRPLCPCCGGGERRKGYSCTKYKSRKMSRKAKKPNRTFNNRESIRKMEV